MKRIIACLGCILALAIRAQTPNQILVSAAPFQALDDRQLHITIAYLTMALSGLNMTPSSVLSNAAAWQGVDDHQLSVATAYLLTQAASTNVGQPLRSLIAGGAVSKATLFTNVVTSDGMNTLQVNFGGLIDSPSLQFYGSTISDVIITNTTAGVVGNPTFGQYDGGTATLTNIELRNVKIYGKERGCLIRTPQNGLVWNGLFYNCWFQGTTSGFEAWHGFVKAFGCVFIATNSITQCAPLINNDGVLSDYYDCEIDSDSTGAGIELGAISYAGSTNRYYNCTFQRRIPSADGQGSLLYVPEQPTSTVLYNCTLRPFGSMAITANQSASPVEIRLENCIIDPPTNGIVFNIDTAASVFVRGGNLQPSNFKNPTLVNWLSEPTTGFTNQLTSQSANYNITKNDQIVLLNGNLTATLPTSVGLAGKQFTIICKTAGTNGILSTSAQTFLGYGQTAAASWTNSQVGRSTTVMSDGANWVVVKSDN